MLSWVLLKNKENYTFNKLLVVIRFSFFFKKRIETLTSRARPFVSIGSRKFASPHMKQATANGLRARITDSDISTLKQKTKKTHRKWMMEKPDDNWKHHNIQYCRSETDLSDKRRNHPSDTTEGRAETHPQWSSHSGINLRNNIKHLSPQSWLMDTSQWKLMWTHLSCVNINCIEVHRNRGSDQEQQHREAKPVEKGGKRRILQLYSKSSLCKKKLNLRFPVGMSDISIIM